MHKTEAHSKPASSSKVKFVFYLPLVLVLLLNTACNWVGANYLLQEGEKLVKVVKIKDGYKTRWKNDRVVIYENSGFRYQAFLMHKKAFGVGITRYSLVYSTYDKEFEKWFCNGRSEFTLSDQTAEIVMLGDTGPPILVVYGPSGGSAGFVDINLYPLASLEGGAAGERTLCADSELEKACTDWAVEQTKIVRDRWLFAGSIDDVLYVLRKVRGE